MRSYEKINYNLRPSKCIERKMLCEVFQRLSVFGKIEAYGYIGFGSTYFSDFTIFHKTLNLKNMISIERDEEKRERFEFNRPFSCIEIKFGESTDVLPTLNWNSKKIVWLDYDGKLNSEVLSDLDFFFSRAISGSVIVVSINVTPETNTENPYDDIKNYRFDKLIDRVGENKIPEGVDGKDLSGWNNAEICRRIIVNEIAEILSVKNAEYDENNMLCYQQLFNFHYSDGAKMLTTGGIVFGKDQFAHFAGCSFNDLSFFRDGSDAYKIEVPNLTFKEIRHLDEQLPLKDGVSISAPSISQSDIDKYEKIYRYFPSFTEANL